MAKWIKIISAFSLVTVLTACGGSGGGSESSETKVSSINSGTLKTGFWEDYINDQYIHIADDSIVYYQPQYGCYVADLYTIKSIGDDQLSLLNNETQVITSVSFSSVIDNEFSMTSSEYIQGDFFWNERASSNSTIGCETTKSIEIEISYRELPTQVRVDDAFHSWSIYFDINKNNIVDSGDLRVSVGNNRLRDDIFNMRDLSPQIWVTSSLESGFGHSSSSRFTVPFFVSNNVMNLTIDDSYQSLIRFIDSDTPMYAEAILNYTGTDHAVFGTNDVNQDGPWNWSTPIMRHSDRYPDSGYVDVDNGVTYTDNLNDQVGESGWIDIDTVKVTITTL